MIKCYMPGDSDPPPIDPKKRTLGGGERKPEPEKDQTPCEDA